jgi:hypothetical protein
MFIVVKAQILLQQSYVAFKICCNDVGKQILRAVQNSLPWKVLPDCQHEAIWELCPIFLNQLLIHLHLCNLSKV